MATARRFLAPLAAIAVMMLYSTFLAQDTSGAPATSTPPPAASPGSGPAISPATAPAPIDHCKALLDEYDQAKQRQKFLAAAGTDNQMDRSQFEADKARGNGFVRPFDKWEAMLKFAKDGGGKIGWFEADAYRRDLREKLLAYFDAEKTGKLSGRSRELANIALEAGWAALSDRGRRQMAEGLSQHAGSRGEAAEEAKLLAARAGREEAIRKLGSGGDANLSEAEQEAAIKAFQEEQRREALRKYEKDENGQLTEAGRAAMEEDQRKAGLPWNKMFDGINRRLFDSDEDGNLSEQGRAEAKEFQKELEAIGKDCSRRLGGLSGDANETPEERDARQAAWKRQSLRIIAMTIRYIDTDGDGKITVAKRDAFARRVQQGIEKWLKKFIDKYDTTGTGKLGPEQRAQLIQGIRDEIETRINKFDTEGKGRLTPSQTLDMLEDFAKEIGLAPKPRLVPQPEE